MSSDLQQLKAKRDAALAALRVAKKVYDRLIVNKASEAAIATQRAILKQRFAEEDAAYKAYCQATLSKAYNTKRGG